jgi:histidine triad (HIT) family protein
MAKSKDCPFCNIHPERNNVLKRTKNVIVMLSNPRQMPGHLLVIPRRHVEKPSQLTMQEREEIFGTIIHYQEKILSALSDGCDICEHYRPFIRQNEYKVNHLHFHLKPRKLRDRLFQLSEKYEKEVFQYPAKKEEDTILRKLSR